MIFPAMMQIQQVRKAMEYQICYENWKNTFSVPCCVTDEFLCSCGAVELKVLLLLLRNQSPPMNAEEISKFLSLPAADVRDALNHWVFAGILRKTSMTKEISPSVINQENKNLPSSESKKIVENPDGGSILRFH